jgi:predicted RNA binding protein with dsRBD fold (UPF0201 family)
MILTVSCPVFPTEDADRVTSAISSLFVVTEIIYQQREQLITAKSKERQALEEIRNIVHSMRVIDTIRAAIFRNLIGLETRILIDKQAAYYGKFRLLDDREDEPSLGAMEVRICFEYQNEFDDFMKWFAPPTRDGKVVQSTL